MGGFAEWAADGFQQAEAAAEEMAEYRHGLVTSWVNSHPVEALLMVLECVYGGVLDDSKKQREMAEMLAGYAEDAGKDDELGAFLSDEIIEYDRFVDQLEGIR